MKLSRSGGFTLVELIVVIAILAVISLLAVVLLMGLVQSARDSGIYGDANRVANHLNHYLSFSNPTAVSDALTDIATNGEHKFGPISNPSGGTYGVISIIITNDSSNRLADIVSKVVLDPSGSGVYIVVP